MRFPTPQKESDLHERVAAGDPVASADLFENFMEPLVAAIRTDLQCDQDTARDAALDALFEYLGTPSAYKPTKGRLSTFITQIGKRRAIDHLRTRSAEARREQEFGAIVELRAPAPNEQMERSAEAQKLWERIEQAVQDERDRAALALILDGERSTAALARVLQVDGLAQLDRQREVKRHRDRLMKVLDRLGARLRDEQGP